MGNFKEWVVLFIASWGVSFTAFKAGMVGGFLSLAHEHKPTFWQALIAIGSGAFAAGYLSPLFSNFIRLEDNGIGGIGFLIGLIAMRLIPGILTFVDAFARDPKTFLDKIPFVGKK